MAVSFALLVEETGLPGEKTADLSQVTDKLYYINDHHMVMVVW
jgi:hypothetical protein